MSVWDFTGAVIWTVISIWGWCAELFANQDKYSSSIRVTSTIITLLTTAGAAYCIGRLCGAHL